ncbi:RNA-directed DNA polymerase, eukaryota [Tanacetum coccineum]
MGDFNEVRFKSDRFGSIFNEKGADEFNSFIANSGLEEVPLGGCNFTWCHKSAAKMSKLDRFLVSYILFTLQSPIFSAITLDRFLSDHRRFFFVKLLLIMVLFHFDFFNIGLKSMVSLIEQLKARRMLKNLRSSAPCEGDVELRVSSRITIDMTFPKQISNDQKEDLERALTKDELKAVVWDCGTDKSPGPDGFTFGFYRHYWYVIEHDVFDAVNYFFNSGAHP